MGFVARVLVLICLPLGVVQAQSIFVVDAGPNRTAPYQVLKFDENGENAEVFINTELNGPQDIVFLDDGETALVSNLSSNKITRYNAETGEYLGDFATGLGQPTRMKIGADGLLYVVQWAGNGLVLRYQQDGTFVDEFTNVAVSQGIGIDWDASGRLYVSSFNARNVRRFDTNGEDLGLFVDSNLLGPTNVQFRDNGELLVLDWSHSTVDRFDSDGVFVDQFMKAIVNAEGIVELANGNYLLGNGGQSSVSEYDANGVYVGEFIESGTAGLATPVAVVIQDAPGVPITAGMNDAWFNSLTPGQGIFLSVLPDLGIMFAAWFTYDTERPPEDVEAIIGEPGHRWYTAQGPVDGNRAELTLFLTSGGEFDSAEPTPETDPDGAGTLLFEFEDCMNGTVSYEIPAANQSGSFPIQRITSDNKMLCELLAEQTPDQ